MVKLILALVLNMLFQAAWTLFGWLLLIVGGEGIRAIATCLLALNNCTERGHYLYVHERQRPTRRDKQESWRLILG